MAAAAGGSGRHAIYGGASSALTHNQFGDNSNTGFAPLAAGYNMKRSSSQMFEDFVPHSTNPNHGPTNFPMQYPLNQEILARNNQNLMNQHGLNNSNNNSCNLFNLGYFQDNTKNLSDQTGIPSLFNKADNNVLAALLRGSSTVAANNFGGIGNANFQGQMNTLAATSDHQAGPAAAF
ncbi:hypothetical protein Bca52824_006524 [Brassica carinata]|uniref:Uncharacterized protein n=1 Tax=Brassica carinata TaxID=52824 RepID=A0A8X7W570_BRACI|nr:hypothetical protein Bca52824_006524 [Brassica carinata]